MDPLFCILGCNQNIPPYFSYRRSTITLYNTHAIQSVFLQHNPTWWMSPGHTLAFPHSSRCVVICSWISFILFSQFQWWCSREDLNYSLVWYLTTITDIQYTLKAFVNEMWGKPLCVRRTWASPWQLSCTIELKLVWLDVVGISFLVSLCLKFKEGGSYMCRCGCCRWNVVGISFILFYQFQWWRNRWRSKYSLHYTWPQSLSSITLKAIIGEMRDKAPCMKEIWVSPWPLSCTMECIRPQLLSFITWKS